MRWPFRKRTGSIPTAIPMPEGVDPAAFERVPRDLWKTNPEEAKRLHRDRAAKRFAFDRERAEIVGATHYIWRTSKDSDVCPVCASREGKRFSYRKAPDHGHAGICTACPAGYCRCYAEAVIPE